MSENGETTVRTWFWTQREVGCSLQALPPLGDMTVSGVGTVLLLKISHHCVVSELVIYEEL